MNIPKRVVSLLMTISLLAHTLLVGIVSPAPAYALTFEEAKQASKRIAAGGEHSLVVRADGTVLAWGASSPESSMPPGLNGVVTVAAGGGHSLAVKSDGTVAAWGNNDFGQSTVPAGIVDAVSVAAGAAHSLILKSDGTVLAWGDTSSGQVPAPLGLSNVVAIAAGFRHSVALKSDGTVVAWGDNGNGQATVPSTLSGVVAIAAGGFHSLALRSNGTVVAWGRNGELQRAVPAGLSGVVAIAGGHAHSLALKSDGTVIAWGGRSGDGTVDSSVIVPAGLSDVVSIDGGFFYSLALKSDGTPVGWGSNASGQCFGVVSVDPPSESKDVPTNVTFTIAFSAPAQAGTNYSKITLKDGDGNSLAFAKSLVGSVLTIVPSVQLSTNKTYTLALPSGSIKDAYGTASPGGNYRYATPDTKPPVVVSVDPPKRATGVLQNKIVIVSFSESIVAGANFGGITLKDGSGSPVDCNLYTVMGILSITPKAPLQRRTTYTLTVPSAAVADLSGNALGASYTSTFTTSDSANVVRISGSDRILTAVGISKHTFSTAETVIIATGRNFPDALAAAPLAHAYAAPILLVEPKSLPPGVATEIGRLGASRAIIVGGTTAVSGSVYKSLVDLGLDVERIAGENRYDTTAEIAVKLKSALGVTGFDKAYVATGDNFPDALAAGGVAAADGAPILLVRKGTIPSETQAAISSLSIKRTVVLGGTGVISSTVENKLPSPFRVAGGDRYSTGVEIAKYALQKVGFSDSGVYIATGLNYPDALAAGVASGRARSPIILVPERLPLSSAVTSFLSQNVETIHVLGGSTAVSDAIADAARNATK